MKTVEKDLYYEAGDFRSDMSLALLNEADIVVTNPPFSLFREYVALLVKYNKQFLIIGNQNAITYKEIFPLLKQNKIWLGYGFNGNVGFFTSPYEDKASSSQHQKGKIRVSGVMWFTNIDHDKRHQMMPLDLGYTYYGHEDMYPKYDNYDGINVNKSNQIPCDYKGWIGVPITFLDKYCPEQFEIINGIGRYACIEADYTNPIGTYGTDINGEHTYFRVLIKFTDNYINTHPEQFKKDGDN